MFNHHAPVLLGLTAIFGLAAVFDFLAAVTLSNPIFLSIGAVSILYVIGIWKLTRRKTLLLYLPVCALLLTILRFVSLSPVKPFHQFYNALPAGASQSEAMTALRLAFPTDGAYRTPSTQSPDDRTLLFILDPDDGRYNAETILLTFQNGSLLHKSYSPD